MKLNEFDLHITNHAYEQYCGRVERIEYGELWQLCKEQIQAQSYHRKREYLHLSGVWWVYLLSQNTVRFVTCYGRHHIDLPKAISWAKRRGDRINL